MAPVTIIATRAEVFSPSPRPSPWPPASLRCLSGVFWRDHPRLQALTAPLPPAPIQGGFNGEVGVTIVASSAEDTVYDGESNRELVVFVEDLEPPGILVSKSTLSMREGGAGAYQVALATAPLSPVTVAVAVSWGSGQPHGVAVAPTSIGFAAGEARVWKTVSLDVAYSEGFIGDAQAVLTHSASSADVLYDSAAAVGAPPVEVGLTVLEQDRVGVCLGDCAQVTKHDHLFHGDEGLVEMPIEVLSADKVGRQALQPRIAARCRAAAWQCHIH